MDKKSNKQKSASKDNGSPFIKLLLFILLGISVYLLFKHTNAGYYFGRDYLNTLLGDMSRSVAAVWFVIVYIVATVLAAPSTIFFILGGVLFGPFLGTVLVVIGATFGASGAFLVTRYLARDFVAKLIATKPWFKTIDDGVREDGIYFVLFLRLVPFFPFNGINFAIGLTHIRFRDFFFGTLVGITPVSFVFVNAAAKVAASLEKGISDEFYYSMALLGLLALIPVVYKKYGRLKAGAGESEDQKIEQE